MDSATGGPVGAAVVSAMSGPMGASVVSAMGRLAGGLMHVCRPPKRRTH